MTNLGLIILVSILLLIVATGIITIVLTYHRKQLQSTREKEQLKVTFEKELLESRIEIQEKTFKNISQELHDNIGQVLSLVKLNISTIGFGNELTPVLPERIQDALKLLGKAIQDIRDLSKILNADAIIEMDFLKAIEYELELIKKAGDYNTSLIIEGEPFDLSSQKKIILFRILQEVLNNIIKHAQAVTIEVSVGYFQNNFLFKVVDDGIGFFISENRKSEGLGLRNIKNRSKLIGADFTIDSEPGEGTTVSINIPYNQIEEF